VPRLQIIRGFATHDLQFAICNLGTTRQLYGNNTLHCIVQF
jgi:hypothetical protein